MKVTTKESKQTTYTVTMELFESEVADLRVILDSIDWGESGRFGITAQNLYTQLPVVSTPWTNTVNGPHGPLIIRECEK